MESRKILVTDDSSSLRMAIVNLLQLADNGYDVYEAADGEEAYASAQENEPDLILMDWSMPKVDGFEALQQLKENEATKDIPVIILTAAMLSPKNAKAALDAGAADFIKKPVNGVELLARLNSALQLYDHTKEIKKKNRELTETVAKLQEALNHVKTLSGLLPICASCKMVRDDKGYWKQVEEYIETRSDVTFSHGICPGCTSKLYPELSDAIDAK